MLWIGQIKMLKMARAGLQSARLGVSRRQLIVALAAGATALKIPRTIRAALPERAKVIAPNRRFPHFLSTPVSYRSVKMQDTFWAPRQKVTREVTVPWVTGAHDKSGGLAAFKSRSSGYQANPSVVNMEAIKFIEAMATIVGTQRDAALEGLIDAWIKPVMQAQGADGYLASGFPAGFDRPEQRWQAVYWSHEDYTIGHYIESAIAYHEATGNQAMLASAVRAADNMARDLLNGDHPYTSGHPEIEQALMRLYAATGERKYLQLCGWLLDQRGRQDGRPSYGRMRLDDVPLKEQRSIQGHAVMAAYVWNGVTQYVAATGDAAYREAVLAVWDDFVNRKMFIHGAGGNTSSKIEGYRTEPYCILPDDSYGESCSVFANFQWAHSLFRLTGEARYIDTAERMLYNAFYASLSLQGDSTFYRNITQADKPVPRTQEHARSCCPPNIVKLFNKVGGYFYSTDEHGVFVNHYGASQADIPWGEGLRLVQRTEYPWEGSVTLQIESKTPQTFALRFRMPEWAKSHTLSVNGKAVQAIVEKSWLTVRRRWRGGDRVTLELPMRIERVTLPPEFKEYENRAALKRGPIVYCLEQQDLRVDAAPQGHAAVGSFGSLSSLYIPRDAVFRAEHEPELLGGVTVLRGEVRQLNLTDSNEQVLQATFVPYGMWDNREPGPMRVWLGARKEPLVEMLLPEQRLGESCVG